MRRILALALLAAVLTTSGCGSDDRGPGEALPSSPTGTPDPGPAVAAADFLAVAPGADLSRLPDTVELDPAEASLVGPHTGLVFDAVASTPVLAPEQVEALAAQQWPLREPLPARELRAADGHEFLLLHRADSRGADHVEPCYHIGRSDGADSEVTIRAGDRTYHLDALLVDDFLLSGGVGTYVGCGAHDGGWTLLVSIPAGADAVLTIDQEGRAQSLDLRTGQRGDDAVALYYPLRSGTTAGELEAWAQASGVSLPLHYERNIFGISASIQGPPVLLPYADGRWAEPGRAWLRISHEQWIHQPNWTDTAVTLDAAASLTLEVDGRTVTAARTYEIEVTSYISTDQFGYYTSSFDVPADFRSGTLVLSPGGDVTVTKEGSEGDGTVGTWESARVSIEIPAR